METLTIKSTSKINGRKSKINNFLTHYDTFWYAYDFYKNNDWYFNKLTSMSIIKELAESVVIVGLDIVLALD